MGTALACGASCLHRRSALTSCPSRRPATVIPAGRCSARSGKSPRRSRPRVSHRRCQDIDAASASPACTAPRAPLFAVAAGPSPGGAPPASGLGAAATRQRSRRRAAPPNRCAPRLVDEGLKRFGVTLHASWAPRGPGSESARPGAPARRCRHQAGTAAARAGSRPACAPGPRCAAAQGPGPSARKKRQAGGSCWARHAVALLGAPDLDLAGVGGEEGAAAPAAWAGRRGAGGGQAVGGRAAVASPTALVLLQAWRQILTAYSA